MVVHAKIHQVNRFVSSCGGLQLENADNSPLCVLRKPEDPCNCLPWMRSRVLAKLPYSRRLVAVSIDTTLRPIPGRVSLAQELLFIDLPPRRLMGVQGSREVLRCGSLRHRCRTSFGWMKEGVSPMPRIESLISLGPDVQQTHHHTPSLHVTSVDLVHSSEPCAFGCLRRLRCHPHRVLHLLTNKPCATGVKMRGAKGESAFSGN
ncbi:hypothetical protein BKA70DRAFT_369771 [Coprinopsis sp. MPI-PUGE-AT-0042]|nr:hypothetical protein BKA70DRAFT_369771 [Coprinopsis sp. MPI-PUGE-AT-0042]